MNIVWHYFHDLFLKDQSESHYLLTWTNFFTPYNTSCYEGVSMGHIIFYPTPPLQWTEGIVPPHPNPPLQWTEE